MEINLLEARKKSGFTRAQVTIKTGISNDILRKMETKNISNYCIMDVAILTKFYGISLFEIDEIQDARYVRSRGTKKLNKRDYNTFKKKSRR